MNYKGALTAMRDFIYDIETYPNFFSMAMKDAATGQRWLFEISDRRNDWIEMNTAIQYMAGNDCRMVGFNNLAFDYPVVHHIILTGPTITPADIYAKVQSIFNAAFGMGATVWADERIVPQLDLYKIHHFDNKARATSLKVLEFNMRMSSIQDLPVEPGTVLTPAQMDDFIKYNHHDVDATHDFYNESKKAIEFREQMTAKYNRDFMNHNDTKIGKDYFIMRLEEKDPAACFVKVNGKRTPRQTIRKSIDFKDVIFDYIKFDHPEFNRVLDYLKAQSITETKGVFDGLTATVNGFDFDFGVGGIHGSVESQVVQSTGDKLLIDLDVASYYPNIAIANQAHPEHLGQNFCAVYRDVYEQRKKHKKGTVENAALKLALNGVYGDSNNKYSPFYDPQYTMTITINGQLLLCMLAEKLMNIPGLDMIQINTDGLTVLCPVAELVTLQSIWRAWEAFTLLELESAVYRRMFIRDVNNYIAEYTDGKVKRKGAYEWDLGWHQDHSQLVVPKVAERALLYGLPVEPLVVNHDDHRDFFLRAKLRGADKLLIRHDEAETQLQKVTRYYISKHGGSLVKQSPPVKGAKVGQWKRANGVHDGTYATVLEELRALVAGGVECGELDTTGVPWDERIHTKNQSKYKIRRTNFQAGQVVYVCNDTDQIDRDNINMEYYVAEVNKLVQPLRGW